MNQNLNSTYIWRLALEEEDAKDLSPSSTNPREHIKSKHRRGSASRLLLGLSRFKQYPQVCILPLTKNLTRKSQLNGFCQPVSCKPQNPRPIRISFHTFRNQSVLEVGFECICKKDGLISSESTSEKRR